VEMKWHKEKRRASLRTTLDGCQRGSEGTPNKVRNVTDWYWF
jgi:hypothetical protein